MLLPQCTVVYAPKDSKRKHHELRFTLPNGDALVLAVQSKEQAHRWMGVSCTLHCTHTHTNIWMQLHRTQPAVMLIMAGSGFGKNSNGTCCKIQFDMC